MITSNDYKIKMESLLREGVSTIREFLEKREGKLLRFGMCIYGQNVLGHDVQFWMVYIDSKDRIMVKGNLDDENKVPYEGNLKFDIINHTLISQILEETELAK